MDVKTWTYIIVGLSFASYIGIAIWSKAKSTKEFYIAHELFDLSLHDFRQLTITAMKSSFLPHNQRKNMIRSIAEEMESEFGLV